MKALVLSLVSLLSLSALAAIDSASLEKRHMNLIEKAITDHCSIRRGSYKVLDFKAVPHRIDQGITDYSYTTVVEVKDQFDQGQYDFYQVVVKSSYSDGYDHTAREWGSYRIEAVGNCELQ